MNLGTLDYWVDSATCSPLLVDTSSVTLGTLDYWVDSAVSGGVLSAIAVAAGNRRRRLLICGAA